MRPLRLRWLSWSIGLGLLGWSLSVLAATGHGPVTLAWDAVTLMNDGTTPASIDYYNVRWGTVSGQHDSGTAAGNVTQFTVRGLDASQLFYFIVTAVDCDGLESTESNEVSARPVLTPHR